jgi:hypothetical protein
MNWKPSRDVTLREVHANHASWRETRLAGETVSVRTKQAKFRARYEVGKTERKR